jgi:hypothetical protein
MNQHDSLVFEVRDDVDLAEVIAVLEPEVMLVDVPELAQFPPMVVDWEVGLTWGGTARFEQQEPEDVTEAVPVQQGGAMQVRFTDGGFSVELSDADGVQQFGEEWTEMSVVARFGKLSALAELLGSDYLFKHGDLEKTEYKERVERLLPVIQPPQAQAA